MQLKVDFSKSLSSKEFFSFPCTIKKTFFPEWLLLKETAQALDRWILKAGRVAQTLREEPLQEDFWGFGFWYFYIAREYRSVEGLYRAIQGRLEEIREVKERFRGERDPFLAPLGTGPIELSQLELIEEGISGSYFFLDDDGNRRFVIKPLDEDIGCLNNPKGLATPFDQSPIRNHMPLYRSCLREVLTYQIAASLGIASIAPKTALAVLESDRFFNLFDQVVPQERKRYLEQCGKIDREKLCSVQEYIPHSKPLFEALHEFQQAGLSDEEIAARFDPRDFEEINLLLWITYDTDGHTGNFLVYPKGVDAIGNEILGLKKIDNGLAFPDKNRQFRNALRHLPNAKNPLSEALKGKIAELDVETLAEQLASYGLESAIPALRQRISSLQKSAKIPGITLREINQRMNHLCL